MSKDTDALKALPRGNPPVAFRLSPTEKAKWIAAANRDGHETLSGWVKWLVRGRIEQQQE